MKIIFLTGGVYSSLGKGVLLSSIGKVLQFEGFSCNVLKFDPYLNYNSRFLSPLQHGEVFVTKDGEETDLDLGHYERFLDLELSSQSCYTSGKIYYELLEKERRGEFQGKTVQVVPHLVQEIISKINHFESQNTDVLLIELGGTVFDIEQKPFLIAASQLKARKENSDMIFIHVAPALTLNHNGEIKTKPIQHSVSLLKEVGINPDLLIIKGESVLTEAELTKISQNFPSIPGERIVSAPYQLNIYEIPNYLYKKEKLFSKLSTLLQLEKRETNTQLIASWESFNAQLQSKHSKTINVIIVGKYSASRESYYSIIQSLEFAASSLSAKLNIEIIQSDLLTTESQLKSAQIICIPPGFGHKSLDGIFLAIKYAREKRIPFLALCLGMQLTIIEFFRNVLNVSLANSLEFDSAAEYPIITSWKPNREMRIGDQTIKFSENSLIYKVYSSAEKVARHRHRYIFNWELSQKEANFQKSSLKVTAWSDNIAEGVELQGHPFFIGVQYHPEFNSRPLSPEPLFSSLISAAIQQNY
ncbi:CTP synthase [Candidatus Mycoplasma haematominutum]|uniref:CTP synthase (glutamine hydrolyzing) n=1 Tax=Candidatus Mycoplasma haematominutum 'Birmingham 1' TaxID=1116213 RepID=G8C2W1_9MOLU|nr:CTP synthase [Candidatus Mycoplasma haematominutum]CCE66659.1 CTP synthase [Candidatus Mycoplasma haematominutum 'Birmingham 1']